MAQEEIERLRPKPVQIGNYMEYRIKARRRPAASASPPPKPAARLERRRRVERAADVARPRPARPARPARHHCAQTDGKRVLDNGSIVDVGERTICYARTGTTVTVGVEAFWVHGGALADGSRARPRPRPRPPARTRSFPPSSPLRLDSRSPRPPARPCAPRRRTTSSA